MIDIVIYHGYCPDGIAGAWCYWRINKDAFFYYASHGKTPPNVENKKVLFIDFVYPENIMKPIIESAEHVHVLDHHKTSLYINELKYNNLTSVIDMNRSGAQLAWDEFNDGPRPWPIDMIADKDLYLFKLENSHEVNRAMASMGFLNSIEDFDKVINLDISYVANVGKILIADDAISNKKIARAHVQCKYKDYNVYVVQCDLMKLSDVAELLFNDMCDIVVCPRFNLIHDCWNISLRSKKTNLLPIVKEIDNDGGGHPNACGCKFKGEINKLFVPFRFVKKNI